MENEVKKRKLDIFTEEEFDNFYSEVKNMKSDADTQTDGRKNQTKQKKYFGAFYDYVHSMKNENETLSDELMEGYENNRTSEVRRFQKAVNTYKGDNYKVNALTVLVVCEYLFRITFPTQAFFSITEGAYFNMFLEKLPRHFVKFFYPLSRVVDTNKTVLVTNLVSYYLSLKESEEMKNYVKENIKDIINFFSNNTNIRDQINSQYAILRLIKNMKKDEKQFIEEMDKYSKLDFEEDDDVPFSATKYSQNILDEWKL